MARALDVLGDRWNMLVVRNLILGGQTWSELRRCLPGIAKNLLSQRLKQLAESGVVEKSADGYELTPKGRELEPILFSMADWGERHEAGPPKEEDVFRVRYLMTSVRRRLSPGGRARTLQLVVEPPQGPPETFWIRLGPNPMVIQGQASADVHRGLTVDQLRDLFFGASDPEDPVLRQLRVGFRRG